jgi:hypothetical protein
MHANPPVFGVTNSTHTSVEEGGTPYKELDVNLGAPSLLGLGVQQPVESPGPAVILPGPVTSGGTVVTPPAPSPRDTTNWTTLP